jgi:hypothetical protein
LQEYRGYLQNIQFEQLGTVNIGGVFDKSNLSAERSVSAFVYRIYDGNAFCARRKKVNNPGSKTSANGLVRGLVIAISKDKYTGSFFRVENSLVASPAAIWIHQHYSGGAKLVANQVMAEHQSFLYNECCTLGPNKVVGPVLTYEHIDQYILPSLASSFSEEIKACDAKRSLAW